MATVKEKLMQKVGEAGTRAPSKVTIVGVGQVGMACAYSIMQQVIKRQACSQGLYSPAPGDGKNRHWKRGCQYTSSVSPCIRSSQFSFPSSSLLLFFPSFLCFLFLVTPDECLKLCPVSYAYVLFLVSSLFPSL